MDKTELRRIVARQLIKAKQDPLYYFGRLKTLDNDEPDPAKRIKPFPISKRYLQNLVTLAETERRLAVYKARRMVVTWTMCGVASRELLFKPGGLIAFIGQKEEDGGKLCNRVKFMYDHLPSYWKLGLPELNCYRGKKNVIVKIIAKFPGDQPDTILQAYAEGGEQLRMDGYTLIYWDEVGLIQSDLCEAIYASAVPALGSTGRLLMSSTPPKYAGHFWYKLVSGEYLGK